MSGGPHISSRYKIADACRLLDVQPYVLRYWLTEFPALASKKTGARRRGLTDEDLVTVRRIKELLYDEGCTIADAKKKLAAEQEDNRLGSRPSNPPADVRPNTVAPPAEEVIAETTAGATPADGGNDIDSLTRRVERLEGGVASLVAQARRLAAELQPEAD